MPTLHENYELIKSLPVPMRYTAVLQDGPATVKISRPTMPQLKCAVEKVVAQFQLHVVAIHSL